MNKLKRNDEIVRLRARGWTYEKIAEKHEVTSQRVQQICKEMALASVNGKKRVKLKAEPAAPVMLDLPEVEEPVDTSSLEVRDLLTIAKEACAKESDLNALSLFLKVLREMEDAARSRMVELLNPLGLFNDRAANSLPEAH